MSSRPNLLGLYHPGTTLLHRLTPGTKLLCLCGLSIAIAVFRRADVALAALCLAVVLVLWSGVPLRAFLRPLRAILIVSILLFAFQWWQNDLAFAIGVVARLLALVIIASVVTATTPIDAMLDTITRALGPFQRVGLNPERVSLAIALMLRSIPALLEVAADTREAAKARGLERNPRALLIPMALRTVARAQATGEALAARGIGDD